MNLICRYCRKPIEGEPVVTLAYWNQTPDWCHEQCKISGEREEALECQIIDADCNDCKHYKRGQLAPKVVNELTKPNGKKTTVSFQPNCIINGFCLKLCKPVEAYPHQWTGRQCFEHRKS